MSQVSPVVGSDSAVSSAAAEPAETQAPTAPPGALGIATSTWIKISVITALMATLFWPNLRRLWDKTNPFTGEANWGHAICVPIISLYYLYVNREKLQDPRPDPWARIIPNSFWAWGTVQVALYLTLVMIWLLAPDYLKVCALAVAAITLAGLVFAWTSQQNALLNQVATKSAGWFGAFVLLYGIALYGYGIYPGQNDFVKDFGMVVTIFGVGLMLGGWGRMQIAWFAVAFLICAIPWPGLLYSRVASPLQQLAANVAVWTLEVTGVESYAGGTKIFIKGYGGVFRTLNVAEACAGLRSLMTFISVGGAVAFLSQRPLWQKIIVMTSAIPIAIFCNVMRVAGQGLLDHYVSQQLSESFAHQFVGMIMLIPAFLLILLMGWVLDQIFLEEVDRKSKWTPTVLRRQTAPQVAAVGTAPVQAQVPGRSLAARRLAEAPTHTPAKPPAPARPPTMVTPPPSVRLAPGRPAAARPPAQKPPTAPKPSQPKPPDDQQRRVV